MLVCIFLWLVVDVIKTMAAKLMANHFHQETYFQRMQEALRKVCINAKHGASMQWAALWGVSSVRPELPKLLVDLLCSKGTRAGPHTHAHSILLTPTCHPCVSGTAYVVCTRFASG